MRPMTRQFNPLYEMLCINMTLLEQKQLFGTCGIKNILAKYPKEDALMMARNYIVRRDNIYGE